MDNFARALDFVLKREGYVSNDPADPGGLTIFGISSKHHPEEVSQMSKGTEAGARTIAAAIYRREYWERCGCQALPFPMDIIVMDTAVNMGASQAMKLLEGSPEWKDYLFARIESYCEIARSHPAFLRGWIRRVTGLYRELSKDEHPVSEGLS